MSLLGWLGGFYLVLVQTSTAVIFVALIASIMEESTWDVVS